MGKAFHAVDAILLDGKDDVLAEIAFEGRGTFRPDLRRNSALWPASTTTNFTVSPGAAVTKLGSKAMKSPLPLFVDHLQDMLRGGRRPDTKAHRHAQQGNACKPERHAVPTS